MIEQQKCKILIVDDVEINLVILSEIIEKMGHTALTSLSARDAIAILEKENPHLILLDNSMPDISGIEFCKMLKNDVYTRDIPVIFISAMDSAADFSNAFEAGAVDYISKPFEPTNVQMRISTHLKISIMQRELEITNKRLNGIIKKQFVGNREKQMDFFMIIAELVAERDSERTFNCKMSEPQMVRMLAQAMQLTDEFEDEITDVYLDDIEMGAILHDVGLILVPDSVLLKKGKLTEEEIRELEKHTIIGSEKIKQYAESNGEKFGKIFEEIVKYHHENYDGTGFPEGLKGDKIPLCARIMRLIDVYEASVNDRCYHKAKSHEETIEYIRENAGKLFDPDIVDVFVKIQKRFID